MKSLILTSILTIFFSQRNFSQVEKVEFEIEKTFFKMSLNSGVYKSRLSRASDRENSFRNFSIFAQVYFPFKRSLDKPRTSFKLTRLQPFLTGYLPLVL